MADYPRPGTNAERILNYIRENPGASVNNITKQLDLNPSPTRGYLKALLGHDLIVDWPDERKGHHYRVRHN